MLSHKTFIFAWHFFFWNFSGGKIPKNSKKFKLFFYTSKIKVLWVNIVHNLTINNVVSQNFYFCLTLFFWNFSCEKIPKNSKKFKLFIYTSKIKVLWDNIVYNLAINNVVSQNFYFCLTLFFLKFFLRKNSKKFQKI